MTSKAKVIETLGVTINSTYPDRPIPKEALQYYTTDAELSDIYVGYADGSFQDGGDWVPEADYDPRQRGWYIRPVEQDGLAFSDPYIDAITTQAIISIAYPVKNSSGQLRGVVSGDISLATLTETVQKFKLHGHGYALLLDQHGVALAHQDATMISKDFLKIDYLHKAVQRVLQTESGREEFVHQGTQLMVYCTLPSTGWKLAIVVPKELVYQKLATLQTKYLILGGGGILLVFLLLILFANQLTRPLRRLTEAFEGAAAGDLTVQTQVTTRDELGIVSQSFNLMTEKFRGLIESSANLAGSVNEASKQLSRAFVESSTAAEEVASSIQDVASRADEQATAMEKIKEMTQQILQEIHQLGALGSQVGESAQRTTGNAEDGKQGVEQIIQQIEEIHHSVSGSSQVINDLVDKSNQIGAIIDIINRIANQTQLLALNAAIEAARAGESGRGFAVVADEIKDLAEETVASATQIGQLIQGTQEEASKANQTIEQGLTEILSGKEIIRETSSKFEAIVGAAKVNLDVTQGVKAQVEGIVRFIEEILVDVESVNGLALETSAGAEEVSASTEEQTATLEEISASADLMHQMADELKHMIEQFRYK